LAKAALELVGTPFRLHGRDAAIGLDCVGLVDEAMRRSGLRPVAPTGYRLRSSAIAAFLPAAEASGLEPCDENPAVVLVMVNPVQPHLIIPVKDGFVHAHAGVARVTFCPGEAPWPIAGQWQVICEGN
jgi:hypothetical protein